jgi:hypothetical protein
MYEGEGKKGYISLFFTSTQTLLPAVPFFECNTALAEESEVKNGRNRES